MKIGKTNNMKNIDDTNFDNTKNEEDMKNEYDAKKYSYKLVEIIKENNTTKTALNYEIKELKSVVKKYDEENMKVKKKEKQFCIIAREIIEKEKENKINDEKELANIRKFIEEAKKKLQE